MVDGVLISYNKLWKLLIEMKMSGSDLRKKAGLTTTVMAKMKREEPVHLEALIKICKVLECGLDDIVEVFVIKENEIKR